MSLHVRPLRRLKCLLLLIAGIAALGALAGCGSRDTTAGQQRFITPSMSEGPGTPLLFAESRAYVWADDRY